MRRLSIPVHEVTLCFAVRSEEAAQSLENNCHPGVLEKLKRELHGKTHRAALKSPESEGARLAVARLVEAAMVHSGNVAVEEYTIEVDGEQVIS